jgi:hypothetical protein
VVFTMSYEGFFVDERWRWEDTSSIQFCPMDEHANRAGPQILEALRSVVTEFHLSVAVEMASESTCELIRKLLTQSSADGTMQCEKFLDLLNDKRTVELKLATALLIAFSGKNCELKDCSSGKPDEPPEWGWTSQDGLILVRLMPNQPLHNIVRHEMGHLLGIDEHHSGCLMDWSCAEEPFCQKCKDKIVKICNAT